ncbi:hypothetical protein COCCU_10080 [Corynebacterium occultum]|uniref:Uncharacterized protein n=1 Tax=Corynebacterium occultum TaxID=2675219 RepID=A0A6B8W9J2_9CORY|nr:hypothetical protein [Corynebacterium occultum]QGU07935.1 hypothetical protein COCCU_10080 [Corynebacterium occultum]
MIDWITQTLTLSPLWVQALVVFAVVLPLCSLLALVLIRVLDVLVGQVKRVFSRSGKRGIGEVASAS